ncbi:MAG TPA: cytochrome c [Gallionella sp.]|nr:cytochrome c [Gallionella sp.]
MAFVLCILCGTHSSALAQAKHSEARGELLYAAHCIACHASEVHWRKQKLAADWRSLKVQVRRWQANIGLTWSEEEITDVARYLNAAYYDFPDTDQKDLSQGKNPGQILRK